MKLHEIIKKLTLTTLWFTGFVLITTFCIGIIAEILGV